AFGGFAQLTPAVIVALYWRKTTTAGMYAGVLVPQVVYVAFTFLPETVVAGVPLFAETYLGWGISLYGMVLGLVVTVAVSAVSTERPGQKTDQFFDLRGE
ncbi:MAG: sodium:solute symporter family protein, partial [Halanaeroarchaeum sp.]